MARHSELTSIHLFAYVSSVDPGAVGAGRAWVDTTDGANTLKLRNASDTGWEAVGAATTGTVAASAVTFAPAAGIAATDVQAAIVEDAGDLAAHLADTTAAHAASAIAFAPTGTIAATDVQAALAEVASEAGALGAQYASLTFVIDGGGSAITTGIKGDLEVPANYTILRATALADQTGSIVVDVWRDTYSNYPPVDADSITASAPVTISSAVKSQDSTLSGWTTSLSAGDILRYNVDSATTIQRLTVSLRCQRV